MAFDYSASFGGINNALANLGKQNDARWLRDAQADVGQSLNNGDYAGAAQKAFGYGDSATGLGLLKLGEQAKDRSADASLVQGIFGGGAPAGGTGTPLAALGKPSEIENTFVNTVKGAGLTNPVGLAAVAAYGKAESGYAPQNVNRTWNDPSQSGQPGTSGGIMSWRAERLQNLYSFAKQRGESQPSVQTQALFLAQEDPSLLPKLQVAKTTQEANQIMANAWRFAGYNQQGGENGRRLALTNQYAQRFGGQGGAPAGQPVGVQVAQNEADVQRLEAQQGNPVVDSPTPVQVAQAAPQPGSPVADVPAQGAAEAQFFIPGSDTPVPQSIANDPRVLNLQRALAGARGEQTKAAIQARLNSVVDDLKAQRQENAPTEVVKNYRFYRQEEQAAGRTPMSFQQFRESTKPSTTIKNEGTIPAGYRAVRDANGNVERLEAIPGSEAASKVESAQKKAELQQQQTEMTGNVVINSLNDIDRLMKEATLPTTGAMGSRVADIKGTAAHDIRNALTTIGANISFQNLQQMRAASPTGGALGAVSDSEQKMLSNAWGALEQSQSEGQFKTNLGRVRAIFERIVHGRTLTGSERASGGPMTPERARSLQDEARQAIASGAPKEQVTKRLVEYGIPVDGL